MPGVLISPTSFGIVLSRILNHYYFFFFIVSNLQFYRFFFMMKWLDIFFHFSFFSWRAANFSLIFERFFLKFWGAQNCGNWFKTVRDRAGSWLDGNPTIEKVLIERCKHLLIPCFRVFFPVDVILQIISIISDHVACTFHFFSLKSRVSYTPQWTTKQPTWTNLQSLANIWITSYSMDNG